MVELRTVGLLLAAIALAVGIASTASAATYSSDFDERTLVDNLTMPTGVAWTPDGRMLITEKSGQLKLVPKNSSVATQIYDNGDGVNAYWDRGLLDVAVDSQFASNHFIYLLYTVEIGPLNDLDDTGRMVSRLVKMTLNDNNTVSAPTTILGTYSDTHRTPCPAPSNTLDCIPSDGASHSIGTVRSAPDGTLYVGSGDSSSFAEVDPTALRTYNEQSLSGKIIHIDRSGKGVAGHPFCPTDTTLSDTCTKIFAKGFRNPFRFTLRPNSAGLVVGDVGWNTREEVDLIPAGGGTNSGWPCYEGTIRTPGYKDLAECAPEYAKEGTSQADTGPVYDYPHPPNSAVIGGPTYTGSTYPAAYQGRIFFGDYAAGGLKWMDPADPSHPQAFGSGWSGTDIEQDPAGNLAYVSFGTPGSSDGSVREIFYSPTGRAPIARISATPTSGPAPLAVAFDARASTDPDNDPLTYTWDFGDGATATGATVTHTYTAERPYTATVTARDPAGHTDIATKDISVGNDAPVPRIDAPVTNSTYRDGQTIQLQGSATDTEDGALAADKFSWDVTLHHQDHTHPIIQRVGVTSPSFQAVTDHDADSYYEITLTVRDSGGVSGTTKAFLYPETVPFTITSSPPGAPISYGGRDYTAPFPGPSAIGFKTSISAADSFSSGGRAYQFSGWSDGGARLHDITVPGAPTTLTAVYSEVGAAGSVGAIATGPPAGDKPPSVSIVAAPSTTVPRRPVTFTTRSSDPDGSVLGLAFDFNGDGKYESTVPPLHGAVPATSTATKAFPTAGKKTVRVRATDDKGATSVATATVVVRSFAVKGTVPSGQTLARIKAKGVKASSTCPYGCRLRATVTVDARSSRRLGLASGKKAINLAAKTMTLSPGRAKTFTVKPTARLARKLRSVRGLRLTLVLTATDSAGNHRTEAVAVRLAR
jgi:glucose/arabinose dehydrogenase/PKD repeat protein